MNKRKALWFTGVVATFVLFYFLVPNSLYNLSPMFFSMIGAALFTFFLIQTIGDFKSIKEFNKPEPDEKRQAHSIAPWMVIPGIAMIFVFAMNFSSNEKAELKTHGQKVSGTIIDGSSFKTRRGGTYNVTVKFETKEGKQMIIEESVGEQEFKSFHKGQEVELVYSSKDPAIIELLTNNATIETYSGVKDRDISAKDLMKLVTFAPDSVGTMLNDINYQWAFKQEDSAWINQRKNLLIKVKPGEVINYLSFSDAFTTFPADLTEQKFEQIASEDEKVKLYENEEFLASVETQTMESAQLATIITMWKK